MVYYGNLYLHFAQSMHTTEGKVREQIETQNQKENQ